ncbi:hypothetical protein D3OALGB2SA_773 [Olavius algarvensis associated proteobacterium Delta 3]|nr:hypothetical protein D3OALGB2SA_773 [Olavius algarvensis associated proteobacterium Delta 3]
MFLPRFADLSGRLQNRRIGGLLSPPVYILFSGSSLYL